MSEDRARRDTHNVRLLGVWEDDYTGPRVFKGFLAAALLSAPLWAGIYALVAWLV